MKVYTLFKCSLRETQTLFGGTYTFRPHKGVSPGFWTPSFTTEVWMRAVLWFQVEVMCNGEIMGKDHTLEFVFMTRWRIQVNEGKATMKVKVYYNVLHAQRSWRNKSSSSWWRPGGTNLQLASKLVERLCPKGLSDGLPTSKGEIKLSLVHPLHAVLCRFSTCRKQQTPQLWMEVRGEWCGLFFSVKFSYSTTMSQQFCRRLWVFAKIYRTATQEKMRDFSQSNFVIQ